MGCKIVARAALVALALFCGCKTEVMRPAKVGGTTDEGGSSGNGGGGATGMRNGGAGGSGGTVVNGGPDAAVDAPMGAGGTGGSAGNGGRDAAPVKCDPTVKKSLGQACGCAEECSSGFCADGVCCNLACTGACTSCGQPGMMGQCIPVKQGTADPHGVCRKDAPETCGQSGLCNGLGGCSKHPPATVCKRASCSGGGLVPASICDGNGTCLAGSPINCSPFVCANAACKISCTANSDCAPPHLCVNGSCGLRGLGQQCTAGNQCKSGNCVDGVCCDSACTGKCSYCALPSSLGRCTAVGADSPDPRVAAGVTDPTRICADQGAGACGTNGRCDGAGGCQRYADGTVCKGEGCDVTTNRYTASGVCRNGSCFVTQARSCFPYKCGMGSTRCASACGGTVGDTCLSPAVCQMGSCGKKPNGSVCSGASECVSGFCAQGVCCNAACNGSCYACNLAGSTGSCTAVPDGGADPAGMCKDEGPTSCGNDGTCNGSGGCRKYGPTTVCAAQKCASGSKTTASTCSGTGMCQPGTTIACAPYVCNADGTDCFNSCSGTGDAPQCAAPNKCNDAKCGPAGKGQDCSLSSDCKTGLSCVEGVCCDSACTGGCRSCKVAGSIGTCTNLPSGTSSAACPIDPSKPCGNTGKCNGGGGCALASTSKLCKSATCTSDTGGTNNAFCDGAGKCSTPTALVCGFNRCDTGACKPCAADADCTAGKACDIAKGQCGGLSANGVSCTASSQCASGFCVDNMCCARACGECEVCSAGACVGVADGQPDDSCSNTSVCGNTGKCQSGHCAKVPDGTVCGTACGNDMVSRVETTCSGGACAGTGKTTSCNSLLCTAGSCAANCNTTTNVGCPTGKVCVGGTQCKNCDPSTNKGCMAPQVCENDACVTKTALGGSCNGTGECVAGTYCVDKHCCERMACDTCAACDATGKCTSVVNAADPDTCPIETATNKCGRTGCDATGTCKYADATIVCTASCPSDTTAQLAKCDGAGNCGTPATTMCSAGFKCANGQCSSMCTTAADCVSGYTCSGGACKKMLGQTCAGAGDCDSGFCADGVCCNEACTGSCRTCSAAATKGTCSPVISAEDADTCPNESGTNKCGRLGCDGTGTCKYTDTTVVCGSSCADTATESDLKCDGMGKCGSTPSTVTCQAGYYCPMNGTGCVAQPPDAGVSDAM